MSLVLWLLKSPLGIAGVRDSGRAGVPDSGSLCDLTLLSPL